MALHRFFLIAGLTLFLASCTTTPKLHLKTSGVSMELSKPASYVFSVAFVPNSKYALAGSLNNLATLWDLDNGRAVKTLRAQVGPGISVMAMSRDGRYLLTGTKGGGDVRFWDAERWKEIRSLPGHTFTEAMEAFAFSPDGRSAVSGGSYHIKRWELETGKELGTITHASFFDRNQSYAMAFSPDGRLAFVKGIGFVSLWNVTTGEKIWVRAGNTGGRRWSGGNMIFNSSAAFSPRGEYILSGEGEKILLRDVRSGNILRTFLDEAAGETDSVAFSPDGNHALSGSTDRIIRLWDVQTGKRLKQFIGHSDEIAAVAFSADGRRVLSGGDASTRLWDVSTAEEVAAMMAFDEKEWLVITPEGYYNASENSAGHLNVLVGEDRYGVDKFYDVFYRPDIVAAKLRGEDIRNLVTIKMSDAIKSPPPSVEIGPAKEAGPSRVNLCYQVKSAGGGIGEVRIFHNGKLVQSDGYYREAAKAAVEKTQLAGLNGKAIYEDMRSVSLKEKTEISPVETKSKGAIVNGCKEIEAIPGENEVSVSAFNSQNTVQGHMKTVSFRSRIKPAEAHLYILAIGIDQYREKAVNLKYAVKDAEELQEKIKTQAATLYPPQNIRYALLTDKEATKGNILGQIERLAKEIKPQDSFILFVAGHGVLLQNQYYILTHDYSGMADDHCLISSNEIVEMSKKIKSLTQLFIFDTCHAGGVDTIVSGLYDARMSVLAKKMGLHIYASASDQQTAIDGYKGNGLFTHTLLEALNNNRGADKNNDGKISMVELGGYARQATADLSKRIGHAQTPFILNFGKDAPIYSLR